MSPYELPGQLVQAYEDIFFGYEFATQAGQGKRLSDDVIHYYVRSFSNREALRSRFGLYWGLDTTVAQKEQRQTRLLTTPVLAVGRAASYGAHVGEAVQLVADDVQTVVIPGIGHWVAEETPEEMLVTSTEFLAPYRDGSSVMVNSRLHAAHHAGSLHEYIKEQNKWTTRIGFHAVECSKGPARLSPHLPWQQPLALTD